VRIEHRSRRPRRPLSDQIIEIDVRIRDVSHALAKECGCGAAAEHDAMTRTCSAVSMTKLRCRARPSAAPENFVQTRPGASS